MGLLDRLRGRDRDEARDEDRARPDDVGEEALEPVDSITSRALAPDELAVLEAARSHYADRGIDPADLSSIAAAFEAALAEADLDADAGECVTVIATAIGDHLVGHGYRWVVSTDPFGTDLAVEPPHRPVPVVVGTLVAVRWMKRETGWVDPVVSHLARAGSR